MLYQGSLNYIPWVWKNVNPEWICLSTYLVSFYERILPVHNPVCGVFLDHINHWKLFVPSPPQLKIVYHLHNCRTITKIAQEEPDPLLLKEHFTNLLNYRQLKASFRLSNLWLQGFVTSKLYVYFYLYCHYKPLRITTSYLLYIILLQYFNCLLSQFFPYKDSTCNFTDASVHACKCVFYLYVWGEEN